MECTDVPRRDRPAAFRWIGLAIAMLALAATIGACGSSDDSTSTSSSSGSASTTSAAGGDVVAGAKTLFATAQEGLTYSETDFPTKPEQIEPYGDWRGPATAPAPKKGATIQVIVCTKQSPACMQAASGIQAAGKALGWKVDVIDGAGTPQGFAQAFDTAFSRNPDGIINVAVPTLAVGDKLVEANKKGIVTAVTGDIPPTGDEQKYDAYVSFRMPLMESMLAYAEIARTDGKANSIVVTDPGFPSLVEAMGQYTKIMKTCSGCKTSEVKWKITDASDPTKVSSIVAGALSANPDATSIALPYGIGLPAVVQAVAAAGKADQVKILVKDGDAVGLQAVSDGQALYTSGASPAWAGWAAVDQVIRGLAKEPYLDPSKIGIGIATFTQETAPKDGNIDSWSGMFDYAGAYQKAWGVG